ncbi:unnamed protein product [Colias eurytheme]|nr:unnamed protein product [Colias eurytheme]
MEVQENSELDKESNSKTSEEKMDSKSEEEMMVPKIEIKTEPPDYDLIADALVKQIKSSTSKAKSKKDRNPIIERRKKIIISDDEWEPEKKEAKPTQGSSKSTEEYYSYDILNQIEIVTITEDERAVEFTETYESRKHMNYVCDKCAVGFVVKEAYDVHMKLHTPESGSFVCEVCETYLKSEDTLHRHKLRHYRRYRCMVCSVRFKDKDAAAGHVSYSHSGFTFNCEQCGSMFKRPQYLRRHIEQMHTKATPMECPVCHQVFYESGWYRNHVRKHNKEVQDSKIVRCRQCEKTFKDKTYLKQHMLMHESRMDVVCIECSTSFQNIHLLDAHYKEAHPDNFVVRPDEENRCTSCNRAFETRAKLHSHIIRMHVDGGKKYQCDYCKRLYFSKGEVRSHITWSHLHAGGHACTCGRVFRTPVRLRDHVATRHLGAVPPRDKACPVCGKAFANQQVLTRHIKGHAGETFPCGSCGRRFKTQSYVKVHYQVAHLHMSRAEIRRRTRRQLIMVQSEQAQPQNDNETFACEECGKQFKTQSYVRIHYYIKHLNMTREEAKRKSKEVREATASMVYKNPLQIEEVFVKTEAEDGEKPMEIPMFETFIDIQREGDCETEKED